MIVHIATDEKFIDSAYQIYDKSFPGINQFLILKNRDSKIRYLSSENPYVLFDVESNYLEQTDYYISVAKICVFHGMNEFQAAIANRWCDSPVTKVWSPFGAEVNNNPVFVKNVSVGPLTQAKFVSSYKRYLKNILRPIYYNIVGKKENRFANIGEALKSMEFTTMLDKEEYENFQRLNVSGPDLRFIKFTYYPILSNQSFDSFKVVNKMLIGNSAFPTNNHLEIFEILKNFDLSHFELVAPLSYGNLVYAQEIHEIGSAAFGQNFYSLREFMPLTEYNLLLQSCGVVVINSYRTQGAGNILFSLIFGAKVFLSHKNTFYHYLKRLGCHVYSIEEDCQVAMSSPFKLLSKSQMIENRKIILKELSIEEIIYSLRKNLKKYLD